MFGIQLKVFQLKLAFPKKGDQGVCAWEVCVRVLEGSSCCWWPNHHRQSELDPWKTKIISIGVLADRTLGLAEWASRPSRPTSSRFPRVIGSSFLDIYNSNPGSRMACLLNVFLMAVVLASCQVIVSSYQLLNSKTVWCSSKGRAQKTEVNFRGELFNVTSGCPSKNPEVLRCSSSLFYFVTSSCISSQVLLLSWPLSYNLLLTFFQTGILIPGFRWHEFCTVLYGDTTVCSNRGLGVKRHLVPKYRYTKHTQVQVQVQNTHACH